MTNIIFNNIKRIELLSLLIVFALAGCDISDSKSQAKQSQDVNNDVKNIDPVWNKPLYHKPSVCCDTEPKSTVFGTAITILFQNNDGELRLPANGESLAASKVIVLDIPAASNTKIDKASFVNSDIRFGIIKPVGTQAKLIVNINGIAKQLFYDNNTVKGGSETLSLSIPASQISGKRLSVQMYLFLERSSNKQEVLVQLDSMDTCVGNTGSKVCITINDYK